MDVCHLDRLLEVNAEDFDCSVEAGVSRMTMNAFIRDTGLWFPIGSYLLASLYTELINAK